LKKEQLDSIKNLVDFFKKFLVCSEEEQQGELLTANALPYTYGNGDASSLHSATRLATAGNICSVSRLAALGYKRINPNQRAAAILEKFYPLEKLRFDNSTGKINKTKVTDTNIRNMDEAQNNMYQSKLLSDLSNKVKDRGIPDVALSTSVVVDANVDTSMITAHMNNRSKPKEAKGPTQQQYKDMIDRYEMLTGHRLDIKRERENRSYNKRINRMNQFEKQLPGYPGYRIHHDIDTDDLVFKSMVEAPVFPLARDMMSMRYMSMMPNLNMNTVPYYGISDHSHPQITIKSDIYEEPVKTKSILSGQMVPSSNKASTVVPSSNKASTVSFFNDPLTISKTKKDDTNVNSIIPAKTSLHDFVPTTSRTNMFSGDLFGDGTLKSAGSFVDEDEDEDEGEGGIADSDEDDTSLFSDRRHTSQQATGDKSNEKSTEFTGDEHSRTDEKSEGFDDNKQ